MARNPDYEHFLDIFSGRKEDPDPPKVEIPATKQEIGWVKQQQFRRAMHNARQGKATNVELHYLAQRGYIYPTTPEEYIKKP